MRNLLLASVLLGFAIAPARAALINFHLSGSQQAAFRIDTNTNPDYFSASSLIGNQTRFDNVTGTYAGVVGTASISFGTSLIASLNISGSALGFTQLIGADLFSGDPAHPTFALGTFLLRNPFFGQNDVLEVSQIGGVPEPSTWTMLLLGFACLGVASYRASSKPRIASA